MAHGGLAGGYRGAGSGPERKIETGDTGCKDDRGSSRRDGPARNHAPDRSSNWRPGPRARPFRMGLPVWLPVGRGRLVNRTPTGPAEAVPASQDTVTGWTGP